VLSIETASNFFEYSNNITGAEWPSLKQIVSPCPTLKVIIGAVTQGMVKREELKRMREMGRLGMDGLWEEVKVPKVTTSKKAALVADTVVSFNRNASTLACLSIYISIMKSRTYPS
jgi:hypothetical protein